MQQLLGQIKQSTFIRHNTVFFIGSLIIGLLNYLYYPILGRLMDSNSFGEVQTLFSLFSQFVIFLSVMGLVTINVVANYEDRDERSRVILELEKISLAVIFILIILTILGSSFLMHFFNFGSAVPFIMLALALAVSVPLTFRNSYLRGKQKFGLVSWIGIIGGACDIIFSVILVLGHTGATGAVTGLVIAQIISIVVATIASHRYGFVDHLTRNFFTFPNIRHIMPELKYALIVLVGSFGVTMFYSMDILLVKHYFDAQTAGLYAGISTVGRIIFFVTASISQVLMPAVKLSSSSAQNQGVLLKSFILLVVIGGVTWCVFALAPRLIIRLLMGSKYLPYASLLPRLSLVLLVVSIANLFITYHIALRRYLVAVIVIIGISATLTLVYLYHSSLVAVINSLLFGCVILLVLLSGWVTLVKTKQNVQA